jgi:lysozyme
VASVIDRALPILANEEGLRWYVYDDKTGEPIVPGYTVIGHPTIFIGLCVEKGRVPKLPQSLPHELLEYVAASKWNDLQTKAPWVAGQPEDVQLALALMAFQLGANGVLGFKRMCAALRRGDRATAEQEALDSEWYRRDTPARAARVAAMIGGAKS